MSDLEKLLSITISFEMCEKTPVVEQLSMSLRQLACADFKSLHQQRARGDETICSLHIEAATWSATKIALSWAIEIA